MVEDVGFQYTAPAAKTEARHPNTTMIQILLCWSVLNSDGISKISAIPDNASPMMHVAHNEFLLTIAPSLTSLQVKRLDRRRDVHSADGGDEHDHDEENKECNYFDLKSI